MALLFKKIVADARLVLSNTTSESSSSNITLNQTTTPTYFDFTSTGLLTTHFAAPDNFDSHFDNLLSNFETIYNKNSTNILEIIIMTILFILGLIGNLSSIKLFREKAFMNSNEFFKYLALMDIMFLTMQYTSKLFLKFQLYVPYLTDCFCKFYLYSMFWVIETCTLLLVLINLSQLLTIACSIHNSELNSNTNGDIGCLMKIKNFFQNNSIALLIIFLATLNIPNIYFSNVYILLTSNNQYFLICGINGLYSSTMNTFSIILITATPYFLIILITVIISVLVLIPKTRFKVVLKQTKQYQCVLTTVFLNIFYIISYFLLIYSHIASKSSVFHNSTKEFSIEIMLQVSLNSNTILIHIFIFFYSSIKPFIYLFMSQSYRNKMKRLFFTFKNQLRFNRYRQQDNFGVENGENRTEVNVVFHNNNIRNNNATDEVVIMQRNIFENSSNV